MSSIFHWWCISSFSTPCRSLKQPSTLSTRPSLLIQRILSVNSTGLLYCLPMTGTKWVFFFMYMAWRFVSLRGPLLNCVFPMSLGKIKSVRWFNSIQLYDQLKEAKKLDRAHFECRKTGIKDIVHHPVSLLLCFRTVYLASEPPTKVFPVGPCIPCSVSVLPGVPQAAS